MKNNVLRSTANTGLPIFLLFILLAVSGIWMTGCSEDPSPTAAGGDLYTRDQVPDADDPFGGYDFGDEDPAFGDPNLEAVFGEDDVYVDPFENDVAIRDFDRDREGNLRDRIFLMITWGNLHRDSTIQHWTDWTGSLAVDNGAVLLKRVIRFEPQDRILPRTQRDLLEWESNTMPAIDGILVRIVACPNPDVTDARADIDSSNVTITFDTEPFTVSFTLDQLPNLKRAVTLDDGNAVAFTAVRVSPDACPRGFLRGVWRHHPERPGGVFFGKWISEMGLHEGFVKGFYGVNAEGEKVFFGKWISRAGRFRGLLRGRWDTGGERGTGWFAGGWIGRDRRVQGRLKGEWRRNDERHGGFFRGVWAKDCEERP